MIKKRVISIIMGGGRGTRLQPLTSERCKPAVPLAGKYRLADIPISNCLNSGINQIFVLTQFNTASLHRHIQQAYKFDPYGGGFVDILSAEQTKHGDNWYQGTADAVRQNLHHLEAADDDLILILSGDQLYQMDFQQMVEQHLASGADVTLAAKPVAVAGVAGLGLLRVNNHRQIEEFVEKPTDPTVINSLVISHELAAAATIAGEDQQVLVNMGIYLFSYRTLCEALDNNDEDFGKKIIPNLLSRLQLQAHIFQGYWEDIGTIRHFFQANLDLTDAVPQFNFFAVNDPIYTRARYLPVAKINRATIERAIIGEASIISGAHIEYSVIGLRSLINYNTQLYKVVLMGADYFETAAMREENRRLQRPDIGIGHHCIIDNAIIDKNVRIGNRVRLSPHGKTDGEHGAGIVVRDGILIVVKGTVIADNTVI
ncbi:MAG: glucose-1-phosphate adenylyltransferase [Gammaproteobacteria bacterium]|nr:glucose-1-phosphate adenylyltransferase [Gammaproteobacteria bacterium]